MGALSDYATAISAGIVTNTDGIGEVVVYTPRATGLAVARTGVIARGGKVLAQFADMSAVKVDAVVVLTNDATTGVTAVAARDKITFGGVDYFVGKFTEPGLDGTWSIAVSRVTPDRRGENIEGR